MNKTEQQKEASKSLELGSAVHKDLSETLRELKAKLVDYGKSLAITHFNRDPNEISLVYYMDGAFDSSSVWWPVFVDFNIYDGRKPKMAGMKTFYEYIQEAYGMGFIELLLNSETGKKTNRWDLAEIAMFNWLVSQAKLLNWNFISSEKPIPVIEEEADETDEPPTELKTLSPKHYTEASFNIEQAMLAVQSNIFFAELPADLAFKLKEEPAIKNALAKALWATVAMKHLCRAGTKADNPVDQELSKVENYAHKSRKGEWI